LSSPTEKERDGGDGNDGGKVKLISPMKEFKYETYTGEGWGITYDKHKHELIVSDGSEYIYFWDPDTFEELRYVRVVMPPCNHYIEDVTDNFCKNRGSSSASKIDKKAVAANEEERGGGKRGDRAVNEQPMRYVKFINELEYYSPKKGFVLANVWYSDYLVLINLTNGRIEELYDFTRLHTLRHGSEVCHSLFFYF
jgi:hypothetical protein